MPTNSTAVPPVGKLSPRPGRNCSDDFTHHVRPLRNHVITIEKQLTTLVQERRGQLAELFELK